MWQAEPPAVPVSNSNPPAIYVAAKATVAKTPANPQPNKMGVCSEYPANRPNSVAPIFDAKDYFRQYKKGPAVVAWEGQQLAVQMDSVVEIAQEPKHGTLIRSKPEAEASNIGRYDYHYTSDPDYEGEDEFEFAVSRNGQYLYVYYKVMVFPEDMNPNYIGFCNWKKAHWKISSSQNLTGVDLATNPYGIDWNNYLSNYVAQNYAAQTSAALSERTNPNNLSLSNISNAIDLSNINLTFAPLSGGAVGTTVGELSNTPHDEYQRLGKNKAERLAAYRQLFKQRLSALNLAEIRDATNKSWVLGEEKFKVKVQAQIERPVAPAARGGDRKSEQFKKIEKINRV